MLSPVAGGERGREGNETFGREICPAQKFQPLSSYGRKELSFFKCTKKLSRCIVCATQLKKNKMQNKNKMFVKIMVRFKQIFVKLHTYSNNTIKALPQRIISRIPIKENKILLV